EGSDVDRTGGRPRGAALVGCDAARARAVADGLAAGLEGHGLGRAPVVAQGCQQGLSGAAMVPVRSDPTLPVLPSILPIRLWPSETKAPNPSGFPVAAVLPATIVFATKIVLPETPTLKARPPPVAAEELPLTVQFVSVVAPL